MGVPSEALLTPMAARQQAFARKAPGQDRVVTFWLNFEASKSAPYQVGMHELTVDKPTIDYADLKLMGGTHSNMLSNQGGVYYDGTFYCCNGEEAYGIFASWIFHFKEANDWKLYAMYDPDDPGFVADMVTLNPVTKKAYGTFVTPDGSYDWDLAEVDYKRLERKAIAKHEHRYCAMAFDRQGRWLGITGLGDLYEISPLTGAETYIGSTGLPVSASDGAGFYFQSGCYDPASDTFYWARTDLEGKSAIYAVDPHTAEAQLYAQLPNYTLVNYIMVRASYGTAAAPDAVKDLQVTPAGTGSDVSVGFSLPQSTIAGTPLSGSVGYDIIVDGATLSQGSSAAGAAVSVTLTLDKGAHRVDVVPTNSEGSGILAFAPVFVGQDVPDVPGRVELSVEKTKATVSWPAAVGELGGNVGDVTYTVTRYPDEVVVAQGLTATSYVDESVPAGRITKYSYGVTPVNTVGKGREARSYAQVGGDALEVPYFVRARTDIVEQDFTFVDANGDDITWEASDYWDFVRFSHSSFSTSTYSQQLSDDWMFLPAITMKAGKQYQVEFDEWATKGFEVSEQMELRIGKAMTPAAQTKVIGPRYTLPKDEAAHRTFRFTVSEDGDYYIGFHVAGVDYEPANDVEIKSVAVTETVAGSAPAAVSKLLATPAAGGAYGATVSFTAPSTTNSGAALSQPTTIRIYRNNVLIHTETSVAAGQLVAFTDNGVTSADNGVIQYTVVAANDSGDGEIAVQDVFVGVDKPTVDGITGSVSEKQGKLLFEWTPVSSVGEKEGFVDPALVTYYIYELRGARNYLLGSVQGETSLLYDFNYNEGDQRLMSFTLGTANAAGYLENATVDLGSHVVGEPYRLPFSESLEGGNASKKFFWNTTNSSAPLVVATDDSFDADGGCYQWSGMAMGNYYSLNLGKVSLRGASSPALVFAYKFAAATGSVTVRVKTPDGEVHQEEVFTSSAAIQGAWQVAKVSLDKYSGEEYILPMLEMQSNMPSAVVNIDAINVADMPNYNLGVSVSAAPQLKAGAPADVDIVVRNLGNNEMSDFTVTLYEGSREVFTKDVSTDLSTLQRTVVSANYIPSVFNAGQRVTLRAEVSASRDRTDEDNQYEVEVDILPSDAPKPENLKGESQTGGVALTWEAPSELNARVTEDFEGDAFTDFSTGGIDTGEKSGVLGGGWTLYDGDGSYSNLIDGLQFVEGASVNRCSWFVFNTFANINSGIAPHSGQKFIVSLGVTGGPSYNWLISPAMTGQAQTISFFATEPAGFDNHETLQVLASSTDASTGSGRNQGYGDNTGSFKVVAEFQLTGNGWEEFQAQLPEGTKYFAIRSTSPVATGRFLCVDDITYEVGSGSLKNYNIYLGGRLVATVEGSVTAYTASQSADSDLAVTAVYEGGLESAPVYLNGSVGIVSPRAAIGTGAPVYNLKGQRVAVPSRKGVYVVGGRKVVIK